MKRHSSELWLAAAPVIALDLFRGPLRLLLRQSGAPNLSLIHILEPTGPEQDTDSVSSLKKQKI